MAAKEMYDYFTGTVTPDYATTTFNVTPHDVIEEEGSKNQTILESDDLSEVVVTFSNQSFFYVTLKWTALSEADAGTIYDFYHDSAKANGQARSFKWLHPFDGHTYTVKFRSTFPRSIKNANIHSISSIKLKVLGIAP